MDSRRMIRPILVASFLFNLLGAYIFAFPLSGVATMVSMPWPPPVYRAAVVAFIGMFGLLYLWLALQRSISRELVGFAALVKVAIFGAVAVSWYVAAGSSRGVLLAAGDLVFAALFFWWLRNASSNHHDF